MENPNVRPYRPSDKNAVRALCFENAHSGKPASAAFPDPVLFSDYWTGYYLEDEPGAAWVAEENGTFSGYALGCFHQKRYNRRMRLLWFPRFVWRIISSGHIFNSKAWSLALGTLFPKRAKTVTRFFQPRQPAGHLHINLAAPARRKGVGRLLLDKLEESARNRRLRSLTAETREDNVAAVEFFKSLGYRPHELRAGYRVRGQTFNVLVLAKELT